MVRSVSTGLSNLAITMPIQLIKTARSISIERGRLVRTTSIARLSSVMSLATERARRWITVALSIEAPLQACKSRNAMVQEAKRTMAGWPAVVTDPTRPIDRGPSEIIAPFLGVAPSDRSKNASTIDSAQGKCASHGSGLHVVGSLWVLDGGGHPTICGLYGNDRATRLRYEQIRGDLLRRWTKDRHARRQQHEHHDTARKWSSRRRPLTGIPRLGR